MVWAEAPFANKGGFVRTVEKVSAGWVDAGLFTRQQRKAIVAAAVRADLRT